MLELVADWLEVGMSVVPLPHALSRETDETSTRVRAQVVSGYEALADLCDEWEQLYLASDASPYMCHEWVLAACRHSRGGAGVYTVVLRDGRGLLGLLPFELHSRGSLRSLRMPGQGWATRITPLIAERGRRQPVLEMACTALRQAGVGWDFCRISKVPAGSTVLSEAPRAGLLARWLAAEQRPMSPAVVFNLPATPPEYLAGVSESHRKTVRRRVNGMNRRHVVVQRRCCPGEAMSGAQLSALLNDALLVAWRSWQARSEEGTSISDPEVAPFVRDVSKALARNDRLDLSVLYADGAPVSYIWGPARFPQTAPSKVGFDPAFTDESPGVVHLTKFIEDSIARGFRTIDYGHEFAEYKRRWSKDTNALYEVLHYRNPLTGRLRRYLAERLDKPKAPEPAPEVEQ